jgi:hypothetical protein
MRGFAWRGVAVLFGAALTLLIGASEQGGDGLIISATPTPALSNASDSCDVMTLDIFDNAPWCSRGMELCDVEGDVGRALRATCP